MTPHGSSRKQSLFRQKCPKHTLPFLFHCSSFSSSCSWVAGSVLQPSILWLICLWPLDYSIIRLPFLHVGSLCPWVQISAISQFPVKDFLCQLRPSEPSCSGRPQNLCQEIEIGQFILIIFFALDIYAKKASGMVLISKLMVIFLHQKIIMKFIICLSKHQQGPWTMHTCLACRTDTI